MTEAVWTKADGSRSLGVRPPRIIFIIGHPRSGSTLLGNIFGQIPGVFHAGELGYLWERHLHLGQRKCGCGVRAERCELWSGILSSVQASRDLEKALSNLAKIHGPGIVGVVTLRDPASNGDVAEHVARLRDLYLSIAEHTDSRVVVDGTKRPQDGAVAALLQQEGWDVRLVHLTRHPLEMAISRQRTSAGQRDGKLVLDRRILFRDLLRWCADNVMSSAVRMRLGGGSSLRLRFEDLIRDPARELMALLTSLDLPASLPLTGTASVRLAPNHALGGNRNKFVIGNVHLQLQERRRSLRKSDRLVSAALVAPISWRYGYGRPWR